MKHDWRWEPNTVADWQYCERCGLTRCKHRNKQLGWTKWRYYRSGPDGGWLKRSEACKPKGGDRERA